MLIEFTISNFRSFKKPVTLSMVATKNKARDPQIDKNNTNHISDSLTLLTSAAIYGANASGKSNLVAAMRFMRNWILKSSRESQANEIIPVEQFRLSTETKDKPTFFQMVFICNGIQFRYGFEVTKNQIVSEWLFQQSTNREARIFTRDEQGIHISRAFKEGRGLEEKTRMNALFLSVVAQFNGPIATEVLNWFNQIAFVSGLEDFKHRLFTIRQVIDGKYKNEIIQLVKNLDVGIEDIEGIKIDESKIPVPIKAPDSLKIILKNIMRGKDAFTVRTRHPKYNADGKIVETEIFDMDQNESHGTQKLFYLAGPIVDVLSHGRVLVLDEMDARLHPLIARSLIQLFNSKETNPKRAQLIFTTHDTNLLSNKLFRRDQIWFIEKDHFGASHLYSLAELKVRNDASFENDYIEGRYGAIPFLGNLRQTIFDGA